jgi:hypothetical protein
VRLLVSPATPEGQSLPKIGELKTSVFESAALAEPLAAAPVSILWRRGLPSHTLAARPTHRTSHEQIPRIFPGSARGFHASFCSQLPNAAIASRVRPSDK